MRHSHAYNIVSLSEDRRLATIRCAVCGRQEVRAITYLRPPPWPPQNTNELEVGFALVRQPPLELPDADPGAD